MIDYGDLTSESYALGQSALARRSQQERKAHGQFLTPPMVAHYMARALDVQQSQKFLDPAC